jgi:hypothetical protein
MSSSNSNVGLNLTTLATGTAIANISTNAGASNLDGTTNKMFIGQNCSYSEIATATTTNNAYTLPNNPIVGQTYTIRNDSSTIVYIFPGTTTSSIVSSSGSLGLGNAIGIPPYETTTLTCVSSNGALNTASGTNPFNNPANVYHVSAQPVPTAPIFPIVFTANAYTVPPGANGSIFTIPAPGANNVTITLPTPTSGMTLKFLLSGSISNTQTLQFQSPSANVVSGVGLSPANATAFHAYSGATNVTLTGVAGSTAGDSAQFWSDGNFWYVFAYTKANTTWT